MVNHYITLNQKTTGSVHTLYAVKIFFVVLFETTTPTNVQLQRFVENMNTSPISFRYLSLH